MLKKLKPVAEDSAGQMSQAQDVSSWPGLWEHLTATKYPDGSKRETSSIVVVAGEGGWRGCVSDRDNSRTMWKTADTLEGLLLALEQGVQEDDDRSWRRNVWGGKKQKK